MIVEIWSDVVCPWCYIGKRRFESAVEQFKAANPEEELEIHYRAFMLDPTAPVGESQPVREAYARKFGGLEAADKILAHVTNEAAGEGIEFNMDIALRSNTLLAHCLLVLADHLSHQPAPSTGEVGANESQAVPTPDLQARLKERFLAAYFTEGMAIGEIEVLIELAAEVGIDPADARQWLDSGRGRDEVADQLEFAATNGLTSVPTFVFNRKVAVPGAQQPDTIAQVMERALV
ncbi:MAG: DsbA family oxidoreductase [Actinomycetia bacterium]|nr:DsbA family oxidoreductase [Actinomycetes bacterium]